MKNFEFVKDSEPSHTASLATCVSSHTYYNHDHPDLTENELIEILKTKTVYEVSGILKSVTNMKKICDMLSMEDNRLKEALESRTIIKTLIEEARNEFLTDVLIGDVKT